VTQAAPTIASFGTGNHNGAWKLFVVDDLGGDLGSITSWSIEFNLPAAVWSPVTGLYSNAQGTTPYVAGTPAYTVYASPAITTTYTVTGVSGPCSSAPATVTVTVNPLPTVSVSPTGQCGPVALTATGNSTSYSWSPASGLNQTTGATVTANPLLNTTYTVTGTIGSTGCSNTATATVLAKPAAPVLTPSSATVCLNGVVMLSANTVTATTATAGPIVIPALGNGSVYPSTINVGGLPAGGVRVRSVNINGMSHTFPSDVDILLQSPTGTNVILMSDVGGGGPGLNNISFVIDDAAATGIPATNFGAGSYRPTNVTTPDNFPAPGPGSVTDNAPALSTFTGNLNGDWKLFVVDDAGGDLGSITSWSITFETYGAVWTPVTGLYTDAGATQAYVAGTYASPVYAKPTTTTTYTATRSNASCTASASTVTVTVITPIVVATQPASQSVCNGANVTFTTTLTTGNFVSYQWQLSTGGGPFNNIAGANNASLVLNNVTLAMSGNQYRVVMTNTCTTVTSSAATLTVNPLPVVAINGVLADPKICLSDSAISLLNMGTPVGGFWSGIGVSGFNFVPAATAVGVYTLKYSYTNQFGCTGSATILAKVEDCPERSRLLRDDAVILYPNPNNGRFNIRINSTLYNYLGMRVYNLQGQMVRYQNFGGLTYGRVVPIDLTDLAAATYIVKFHYDDGIRTSEKNFKVVVSGH
jgi:subtilisin-like proprotein convertase family protein